MARVLQRVTATAREQEMFSPGDRVLVAVSGGPDSTCLLYSLHMLRRLFKIELEVFHFDHRLRPDSAKDAQYVRRMAAKLKLPIHLSVAETRPARGESVESWARVARWNDANEVRRTEGFATVALAHTLDDQAETVLLALVRGGGLGFIAGMRPREEHYIVRPLIEVRRVEVEAFCRALRLRPREDPSNRDTRFLRNALRLKVIPVMERATGRDVKGPIARTASLLQDDAAELFAQGARAFARVVVDGDGESLMRARELADLPPAIGGRVVRMAAWRFAVDPEREPVQAVLDLAKGRPGRRRHLTGGLIAVREKEYVRLSRTSPGSSGGRGGKGETSGKPGGNRGRRLAR